MVMKIGCEVEQSLVITLSFDDETTKTRVINKGDYVSIAYNKNGTRRVVNGAVTTIYANPYNGKVSRKDWYVIVASDDVMEGIGSAAVRISILNILDVEVLKTNDNHREVRTPNNNTRVTDIRVKGNYLQISQNGGRSWRNVGAELNDDLVGEEVDIDKKVRAMIGSDQYATADEFVKGIVDIINDEIRRRRSCVSTEEELDDWHNADATPDDSSDDDNPTYIGAGGRFKPNVHYVG